ncbi:hypothetical protein SAMN04515695_1336 [Pseudovibrio sp. Tun.PSC04-5.I4]|nr:hypothetical protein SAMN04515695_1336 [Pseudovibrio sp. Tun.PSC04-5.I4]
MGSGKARLRATFCRYHISQSEQFFKENSYYSKDKWPTFLSALIMAHKKTIIIKSVTLGNAMI